MEEGKTRDQEHSLDERIDGLLAKYVSVWLWSILFGTSITLSFSFIGYRSQDKWGSLGLLLALLLVIGFSGAITSLVYLFYYLKDYLIPTFFPTETRSVTSSQSSGGGDINVTVESPRARDKKPSRAPEYLRTSVKAMVLAVIMRASIVLIELVYSSLSGQF
ncbi:MAG TPA: hypothetical protein VF591_21735 [Pyrinomonadaceae bacterium]|jgi:hypothetical protein